MVTVKIIGWKPGLHTIELIRILRRYTGSGLAETKESVERMIAGISIEMEFADSNLASRFEMEVTAVGCICSD